MGKCGCFFPGDNSLVSPRKSHSSGKCALVARCLPFNPEGSCSNPCVFANIPKQKVRTFFDTLKPPFRLCETFLVKVFAPQKVLSSICLIFCNRTNVKKSRNVLRFFGTMRLVKISKIFQRLQRVPLLY